MDHERRLLKKSDVVIILVILCVMAATFIFFKHSFNASTVEVSFDGTKILTLRLDADTSLNLNEINPTFPNIKIVVENGYVYVKSADCHDNICVRTGKINSKYQSIVCLPNKLVVYIVDDNTESNIDVVM